MRPIFNHFMREYIIKDTGSIFRRDISEEEIAVNDDDIARAITQTLGRSVKGLWPVTLPSSQSDVAGLVNLTIDHERPWFTVPIKELVLSTFYSTVTVDGQARVVPQFQRRLGTEIQLKLTWKTPSTMRLRGLLRGTPLHFDRPAIDLMWLLAYTSDSQIWKLPLPNVYADCKVCTGNGAVGGDSYRDAVDAFMKLFFDAPWNTDLWDCHEKTHSMFNWKVVEGGKFEQTPVEQWPQYCKKVGLPIAGKAVL